MVLEIELPETCECGQENLKIWGTRTGGKVKLDVRCMSCGKVLWKVGK